MDKEIVNSLLSKIGKAFFIKYLRQTFENKVNYTEISKKEDISVTSCYTRVANIKRIIREKKITIALEICSDSKRIRNTHSMTIQDLLESANKFQNSLNHEIIKINFLPDPKNHTDLSHLDELDTIKLYADVVNDLKKKGIIRSAKVTGDLGEHFVVNYFNKHQNLPDLKLNTNKSNKSYDAVEKKNENLRYEIKTITQHQTSDISYILDSPQAFDFLIICKLDRNYSIEHLYKLTFEDFLNVRKSKNDNKYHVKINNKEFLNLIDKKPQIVLI